MSTVFSGDPFKMNSGILFYIWKIFTFFLDYDHTEAEAKHLIYESDTNGDSKLSKDEILANYDLFVGSQATDFGEALTRHDEFWKMSFRNTRSAKFMLYFFWIVIKNFNRY